MSAFKEINPKEITESPFKLIGDDWALVTAGDKEISVNPYPILKAMEKPLSTARFL